MKMKKQIVLWNLSLGKTLMMNYKHDALVAICGGHQTDHKIATFLSFVYMLSQTCARTHIVHVYGATFLEAVFSFLKIQLPN